MNFELLTITVLWSFLYVYVIIASIEFGVGFFTYYGRFKGKQVGIPKSTGHYDPRLWHITIIFFIFFVAGLIGFFPDTFNYFGRALVLPGLVVLLLVVIRSIAHFLYKKGNKTSWSFLFVYVSTGILIPASLSIGLTISEGGFIKKEGERVFLLVKKLFLSPYSWSVVFLAIVSVLFISAVFLLYYKEKSNDREASMTVRGYALFWSVPTIIAVALATISLRGHNLRHFQNALEIWWLFALSLISFMAALYLIIRNKKHGLAFIFVLLQFLFAFYGYGISHLPFILDPFITLDSFNGSHLWLTLGCLLVIGLLLLTPFTLLINKMLFRTK